MLEYVDYLHIGGDRKNFGQGDFPDTYPNKTNPLPATVHIPNIYIGLDDDAGKLPSATDPNPAQKVLGLDNAFALNLTSIIEGQTGQKSPLVVSPTFKSITWDDVPVTTKSDALVLDATLSSLTAVDMDFDLLDANGNLLASSAGATANGHVSASVSPHTTYILRVKSFANGPSTFNIVSDRLLSNNSPNANAGTSGGGSTGGAGLSVTNLVRFTVNPLTKSVTARLLQ